jgi:cell division septation protein DedD
MQEAAAEPAGKPAEKLQELAAVAASEDEAAAAPEAPPETKDFSDAKPITIHKPGSSPETLQFVRSVLDKKDSPNAAAAASVEPAAGAAVTPGSYFVQLASVKSRDGADSEWGKLQKSFGSLNGLDYRVQEANLGDRGTFYRIQAGPMSKTSAGDICDAIKAQKPGGCLVVQ